MDALCCSGENETVELKREVVDDIKKDALAFVNTDGGTLYIGVTDSGEVVGLPRRETARMCGIVIYERTRRRRL